MILGVPILKHFMVCPMSHFFQKQITRVCGVVVVVVVEWREGSGGAVYH